MITIITGEIHQGKTNLMKHLYETLFETLDDYDGDGFLAVKKIVDKEVIGYDYLRLSNGHRGILARKGFEGPIAFSFGPYDFSKEGFDHVSEAMESLIEDSGRDLFLDEIGPIELSGAGYASLLMKMIARTGKGDIYITVRRPFIEQVLSKFHIEDYRILEVEPLETEE